MKLTNKQMDQILECFQSIHSRGGVDSAEVEYLLMILYKNNTYIINKILEKWEKERDQ